MTIEELLSGQGELWRSEQPPVPSLAALLDASESAVLLQLPPQHGRRRARVWLPAVAAAVVLAVAVGTFALVNRADREQAAAPASACSASDFKAVATESGGSPSYYYMLTLRRVGSGTCRVGNSIPQIVGTGLSHVDIDPAFAPMPTGDRLRRVGWSDVGPSDALRLTGLLCGQDVDRIQVQLAGPPADEDHFGPTDAITVPLTVPPPLACQTGYAQVTAMSIVQQGSLASLVKRFSAPSHVSAGVGVDYRLTLTNPTDRAVSLRPCPSYRQGLTSTGRPPQTDRLPAVRLDCSKLPAAVAAHATVTLPMNFETYGLATGPYALSWDLIGLSIDPLSAFAEQAVVNVG